MNRHIMREAVKLHKNGVSVVELSKKYNVHELTIYRWFKKLNYAASKSRARKYRQAKRQVIALSASGLSTSEIATRLGLPVPYVYQTIRAETSKVRKSPSPLAEAKSEIHTVQVKRRNTHARMDKETPEIRTLPECERRNHAEKLVAEGMFPVVVANITGISEERIFELANEMADNAIAPVTGRKLGRPPISDDKINGIRERLKQGVSLRVISRELGISLSSVNRYIKAKDLERPCSPAQVPAQAFIEPPVAIEAPVETENEFQPNEGHYAISEHEIEKIIALHNQGLSAAQVASVFQIFGAQA